ncbi:MAG: polysaccharide deacetylase family protein [Bacteroidota bacterium]
MNKIFFLSLFVLIIEHRLFCQNEISEKPKISFSFDDGSVEDMPGYKLELWNQLLLNNLEKHHLKAILFSMGKNKTSEKGRFILNSWDVAGHMIANHTFSHLNFNSEKTSLEKFEFDFLTNDSLIRSYSNYYPYFRFPYLKEGNNAEKRDGFRAFLKEQKYKNGHVSIDASDWYIDSRLLKRLKENPKADISGFKSYYIQHIYNRALYYDSLSYQLTKRHINHVLLLHHNFIAALFLDDLIQYFKEKGWEVMDADKAYQDEIYTKQTSIIPSGESLIWSLAKESGMFEKVLRYPAEDSMYEKDRMDKLGL